MTAREHALIMVRKAKSDLKKETDPYRKKKIAIWGEEMQKLANELDYPVIIEPHDRAKVCGKCGSEIKKEVCTSCRSKERKANMIKKIRRVKHGNAY